MKSLKDFKITTQFTLILSLIMIFIVIISALSLYQTSRLAERTEIMYEHPLKVRKAVSDLRSDILEMQIQFRFYLLSTDRDLKIKSIKSRLENIADANRHIDLLYLKYLGQRNDIDSAKKSFDRFVSLGNIVLKNPPKNEILAILSVTESPSKIGLEYNTLFYYVNKIDDFSGKKSDELYRESISLNQTLAMQLGTFVGVIIILTLLLLIYLRRLITLPLNEIAGVTKNFSEGKYDERSSNISGNEIGQLAASFNSMADIIRDQLTLNEKASRISAVMLSEDDPHRFCHNMLDTLLSLTGGEMGAVYFNNAEKTEFVRFECYGMEREGCRPFSAVNYEGEFGRALSERKIQFLKDIPEGTRFTFATVTGKFVPREIITIPIVSGDSVVAVISLATIRRFDRTAIPLLNLIEDTLSARLNGILIYMMERELAARLEEQNVELESQKNELFSQANELKEQNVELELQKKELDQSNRLKTTFLSNMSHELRTPLNSVIALSGVLSRRLSGKIAEEEHGFLSIIERNGKNLLSLINDILDIARIESGREEVDIKSFNISTLAREIKETLDVSANLKKIELINSVKDNLPAISSDYEKCRHIILNLAANAVKFTEEGKVEMNASVDGDKMEITITDTGIGISPEVLPHVFDEFRQADSSTARKYGGTGLGLAIAKKYAVLLGGEISAESTLGAGTRFTLRLPLRITPGMLEVHQTIIAEEYSQFEKSNSSGREISDGRGKSLLLVEDNEAAVIQMKDILESEGYRIITARDGKEALARVGEVIPDAMILDLMMPGVDGFEVLRAIRSNEKTKRLPVLILTAKIVTKEELAFLKHNNVAQIVRKGEVNKEQLLDVISRITAPRRQERIAERIEKMQKPVSGEPVVLIVEDNRDNMITIKSLFPGNVKVIEAEDGLKGVEMARNYTPHLIFMDIALPGINGIEALKEIRKEDHLKDIPIFAVTASALKEDSEQLLEIGFDGYFSKPIDINLFQKIINRLFH
ncbi:MAG: response regulator [Ignavibacteriaceae bacterium]